MWPKKKKLVGERKVETPRLRPVYEREESTPYTYDPFAEAMMTSNIIDAITPDYSPSTDSFADSAFSGGESGGGGGGTEW